MFSKKCANCILEKYIQSSQNLHIPLSEVNFSAHERYRTGKQLNKLKRIWSTQFVCTLSQIHYDPALVKSPHPNILSLYVKI